MEVHHIMEVVPFLPKHSAPFTSPTCPKKNISFTIEYKLSCSSSIYILFVGCMKRIKIKLINFLSPYPTDVTYMYPIWFRLAEKLFVVASEDCSSWEDVNIPWTTDVRRQPISIGHLSSSYDLIKIYLLRLKPIYAHLSCRSRELYWSCPSSVCLLLKIFAFSSSSETLREFQPNLQQSILGWSGFIFVQIKGQRGDNSRKVKLYWKLKIFSRTIAWTNFKQTLAQIILGKG